jgi:hypothetical protein
MNINAEFSHKLSEKNKEIIKKALLENISSFTFSNAKVWYDKDMKIHRDFKDGPAMIYNNSNLKYYTHGNLNRPHEDGPAIINNVYRYYVYYKDGKEHRPSDIGPAYVKESELFDKMENNKPIFKTVVLASSYMEHGKLHRHHINGPAMFLKIPYSTTYEKKYYLNGKLHRPALDGWAFLIFKDDKFIKKYWENGTKIENPFQYKRDIRAAIKIQKFIRTKIKTIL